MVLEPEVGEEYEWRRSGKKTRRVRVVTVVCAGEGSVQYENPADEEKQVNPHRLYPDPRTQFVELVQAALVDDPETEQVVESIPKEQLYEIE